MAENTPKNDDVKEINAKIDNIYPTGTIASVLPKYAMPKSGSLYFECFANDAINVIHEILQNHKASLNIQWTLMED